jgi:hypothetical protein
MKKQYSAPMLTVHGNVESITQFGGGSTRNDFLFFNAQPVAQGQGPDQKIITIAPCGSNDPHCPSQS